MSGYTDKDVTFFVGLYRDQRCAEVTLRRVREHFPDARVILRSDGDKDPAIRELADRYDTECYEEKRLFAIENGGALLARVFELFLEKPTRYLFKIDTDTAVHRRFQFLPKQYGVFGTLQNSREGCSSIQGGCIGFTEGAVQTIQCSGILGDPRLKDPVKHRDVSPYFSAMARRQERSGLSSFDWIVGWAAYELQVPLIDFDEIHSRWRHLPSENYEDLRYAVTHPSCR